MAEDAGAADPGPSPDASEFADDGTGPSPVDESTDETGAEAGPSPDEDPDRPAEDEDEPVTLTKKEWQALRNDAGRFHRANGELKTLREQRQTDERTAYEKRIEALEARVNPPQPEKFPELDEIDSDIAQLTEDYTTGRKAYDAVLRDFSAATAEVAVLQRQHDDPNLADFDKRLAASDLRAARANLRAVEAEAKAQFRALKSDHTNLRKLAARRPVLEQQVRDYKAHLQRQDAARANSAAAVPGHVDFVTDQLIDDLGIPIPTNDRQARADFQWLVDTQVIADLRAMSEAGIPETDIGEVVERAVRRVAGAMRVPARQPAGKQPVPARRVVTRPQAQRPHAPSAPSPDSTDLQALADARLADMRKRAAGLVRRLGAKAPLILA